MGSCANATTVPNKTRKTSSTTCIQWNKAWRFLGVLSSEAFPDYLANQRCWVGYRKNLKMTYYKCKLSQHCPTMLRTADEKDRSAIVIYDNGKQHVHPDAQESPESLRVDGSDWKLVHVFRDVISASLFLDSQKYWLSSAVTGSRYDVKLYKCAIAIGCPVMFKLLFDYEQNLAILYSNREEHSTGCEIFSLRRVPNDSSGTNNMNAPAENESASLHYMSVCSMEGIISPRNHTTDSMCASLACDQQLQTEQSQHDDQPSTPASSGVSHRTTRRVRSFWEVLGIFSSWNDAFGRASQNGPWKKVTGQHRRPCAAILKPNDEERYICFFGKEHLTECKTGSLRIEEAQSLALQRWHSGLSVTSTNRLLQQHGFSELSYGKIKHFIDSHAEKEPSCPKCSSLRVAKKQRRDRLPSTGKCSTCSFCDSDSAQASSELERRRGNEPSSAAIFSPIGTPSMNISSIVSPAVSESYQIASIRNAEEDQQSLISSRSGNTETEAADGERMNRALFESSLDQGPSHASPTVRHPTVSRSISSSLDSLSESGVKIKEETWEIALKMLHTVTRQNAWMKRELTDLCAADQTSDELTLRDQPSTNNTFGH
ncbi:hypothetical protein M513_11483 [Trichuris suis]|uniref:Uncharacterized protein n=1 Tax=Trichuris suis TaxID=68888 RepID=A0A085LRM4_9BILA|nr:hypothetical protein M513_11483 [Trichuris suis]